MSNYQEPKLQESSLVAAHAYLAKLCFFIWLQIPSHYPLLVVSSLENFLPVGPGVTHYPSSWLIGKYCHSSLSVRKSFISQRVLEADLNFALLLAASLDPPRESSVSRVGAASPPPPPATPKVLPAF